jgi:hypothetical protein
MTLRMFGGAVASLEVMMVVVGLSLPTSGVVSEALPTILPRLFELASVVGAAGELVGVTPGLLELASWLLVGELMDGDNDTMVEGSITIVLAMTMVVISESDCELDGLDRSEVTNSVVESEELEGLKGSEGLADVELTKVGRSVKLSRSVKDVVSLLVVSGVDPPSEVSLVAGDVVVMVMFMYCRFTWRGK